MNKIISFALLVVIVTSCEPKREGINISGIYDNPVEDQMVKLEWIVDNSLTVVDSMTLPPSGEFSWSVNIKVPGFYRINFYNREIINVLLDSTDVKLVKNEGQSLPQYQITGSKSTDYIYELTNIKKEFDAKSETINSAFRKARSEQNQALSEQIRSEFIALKTAHTKKMKATIWRMDYSIAGILTTTFLDEEAEYPFLDSLASKYEKQLPHSPYTKVLRNKVEGFRRLAIGSPAPELSLPNPDGEIIKLSTFRGQYLMLDFWAAWCGPCRRENPNVVRMYNKYHDNGFEILGISLDKDKAAWQAAIQKDGLTWPQISDLKHFESEAAKIYQINAIPATYLIDPDGIIIAKNLRGPALEAKVSSFYE